MKDILLCEIDIIIQQQIWISQYISALEDRRLRLMDFIQTSEEFEMSNQTRENLCVNVENMEIKLGVVNECEGKNRTVKEKRKCPYDNRGYCKHKNMCLYYHSGQVCDEFLRDGKCETGKSCKHRHPRDYRYWIRTDERCKHRRGKDTLKDTLETVSVEMSTVYDIIKVSEETNDSNVSTNEEEDITMDKMMYRQTEASKDDTIKELKEIESKLMVENLSMKKQIEKLKNIVANMYKELTNSRRS